MITVNEVPGSAKELSAEIIKVADGMKNGEVTGDEAAQTISKWKKFVPSLLFADEAGAVINPTVVKIIGKKRTNIVTMLLKLG